jgi:hypothetical protein
MNTHTIWSDRSGRSNGGRWVMISIRIIIIPNINSLQSEKNHHCDRKSVEKCGPLLLSFSISAHIQFNERFGAAAGIVRSKSWAASPNWEQMPKERTPFVGGPSGNEPHTGCSVYVLIAKFPSNRQRTNVNVSCLVASCT